MNFVFLSLVPWRHWSLWSPFHKYLNGNTEVWAAIQMATMLSSENGSDEWESPCVFADELDRQYIHYKLSTLLSLNT